MGMGARKARGEGKVSKKQREEVRARLAYLMDDWGIETVEKFADELGVGRITAYGWMKPRGENNLPDSASLLGMAFPKPLVGRKGRPVSPTWLLTGIGKPRLDEERPVSIDLARNLKQYLVERMVRDGAGSEAEVETWLPDGGESLEVLVRLARERCALGKSMDTITKGLGRRRMSPGKVLPKESTLTSPALLSGLEELRAMLEGREGNADTTPKTGGAT